MDAIYKFLLWTILSFVGVIILNSFVPNKVIFAFVIAIVIGIIATREEN